MALMSRGALRSLKIATLGLLMALVCACSISYKFNGGSLDYTRIKSISISEVYNRAPIIYPPLAANFTEQLKDFYTSRTRLEQVARAGDLELECTITGYDLTPMAVSDDNYASRTVFTVTMQVKYTNNVDEKESFDRSFKAHRDFDRNQTFVSVQDQLLEEIIEDLIKQIYNATVENW
ncbi:LPS assembly lipoprotein LptE [Porphyromonas sp. COT-290 OH860]|uniref:LPS assembly lipoprotein LptE n=1 Tax=Porphyromonas sp. COT-290 OH860 TaxID=1515615 RepID=UPI0009DED9FA